MISGSVRVLSDPEFLDSRRRIE